MWCEKTRKVWGDRGRARLIFAWLALFATRQLPESLAQASINHRCESRLFSKPSVSQNRLAKSLARLPLRKLTRSNIIFTLFLPYFWRTVKIDWIDPWGRYSTSLPQPLVRGVMIGYMILSTPRLEYKVKFQKVKTSFCTAPCTVRKRGGKSLVFPWRGL